MKINFKKPLLLAVLSISLSMHAFSQNEVSGLLLYSTTWTTVMSPIHVKNNFTVYDTVTLTIEPGVKVIFQGDYTFKVHGNLIAKGTKADSIVFTKSDTIDSWKRIEVETSAPTNDSTIFKYVRVEYANTGGIGILSTNKIAINHCLFTKNKGSFGSGISVYNSNNYIAYNTFSYDSVVYTLGDGTYGGALACYNSTVKIVNNLFYSNKSRWGGGVSAVSAEITMLNNTFIHNQATEGGAILFESSLCSLSNNVFWNNNSSIARGNNIYNSSNTMIMDNCGLEDGISSIYNNSSTITYEGGKFNATCLNLDALNTAVNGPNFTDPANFDYTLSWQSPLINAGDTAGISALLPAFDINNQPRIQRGMIDIGAYESPSLAINLVGLAGENGIVTPQSMRVAENGSQTFVIKPNKGYALDSANFAGLDVMNNIVAAGDSFLFEVDNVIQSDTFYAGFAIKSYLMLAIAGKNGSVSPDSVVVDYGSKLVYTILVDRGYKVASATIGGFDVTNSLLETSEGYSYTIDTVKQADTLRVNFAIKTFHMQASAGEHGTVSPKTLTVDYGNSIIFTITPDDKYEIASARYNTQNVINDLIESGSNFTYKIDSVKADGNLDLTFKAKQVSGINTLNSKRYKIFPNPSSGLITVEGNNIQTIEVINLVGKVIEQITINNTKTIIDLSSYIKGIYFIRINSATGTQIEKIVVE